MVKISLGMAVEPYISTEIGIKFVAAVRLWDENSPFTSRKPKFAPKLLYLVDCQGSDLFYSFVTCDTLF
jgi:hypothetical protein